MLTTAQGDPLREPGAAKDDPAASPDHECVLILAPVGRDGPMMTDVLRQAHLPAELCRSMEDLGEKLPRCLAALLTVEALDETNLTHLERALRDQPPWSDVPVLVLAGAGQSSLHDDLRVMGNITILQRPLSQAFLLSVVQSAIRARRRQYEVRDLLETSARQQADIMALNARLLRAMSETHHRVKNNLQIVTALINMLRMQNDETIPAYEMDRLMRHIQAMVAIHDLLTQQAHSAEETAVLSLKEMTDRLAPLYQGFLAGRSDLHIEIADIRMPVRQATTFAVILNELLSNAVKHGAGDIDILLSRANDTVRLDVFDHGGGFPPGFDVHQAAHTGLELVESLARWDLSGTPLYRNRPEGGAHVSVTFPVPHLERTVGET